MDQALRATKILLIFLKIPQLKDLDLCSWIFSLINQTHFLHSKEQMVFQFVTAMMKECGMKDEGE